MTIMPDSICFTDTETSSGFNNKNYDRKREVAYELNQLATIMVSKYFNSRSK